MLKIRVHETIFFFHNLQKQAMMVRQLEEELRLRTRESALGTHKQMEALIAENEREVAILRETIKVGNNNFNKFTLR